jgi:nucleoside-diphosphate-sugar epimerase/2-polyprenyl-3-methyl-5-hydroxy-6-metoxy-1,4-benzoquinol methylase
MKIAIIGSSGYIGSFLYKNLSKLYDVSGYDIKKSDFCDFISYGRNINISSYDVIIYLAGLSGRVSCNNNTWGNIYFENIEDILTITKKLSSNQLLIYASTAGLLEGSYLNASNESYDIQKPLLDSYTLSMYERECAINKVPNVNTVGLRFGTVIGISPIQRKDLVHIAMIRSAFINGQISVQYPECYRAILWIHDLKNAILNILKSFDIKTMSGHKIYNLASYNTTIGKIADDISLNTDIKYIITKPGGFGNGFKLDSSAFENDFPDFKFKGRNDVIIKELKESIGHICIENELIETRCRVCKNNNLETIIDLGYQSLANNFVESPIVQNTYPLCLMRCKNCNHTQLNYTVKPEVLFRNYQYNSGTSKTLCNYFAELANKCILEVGKKTGRVLELACNDGSQLDEFKKLGWDTYGVDPAINLVKIAQEKGHKIICGFWGNDEIVVHSPDLIIAQNVLAHVPDPIIFLQACVNVMNFDTLLYIQTSQCNMYINGEFDTIYHEHLSFFTISSMMHAAVSVGLLIENVEKTSIHGTSYLFRMKKKKFITDNHSLQAIAEYKNEKDLGLYDDTFYNIYRLKIENIKLWVHYQIAKCKENKIKIIAYGAAAKGMTMLNYFNVSDITYIIDDAIMKHNKYTPGTNIPVLPIDTIKNENGSLCVLVLAWNFIDEIINRLKDIIHNTKINDIFIMQVFPRQEFFKL